MIQPMIF